MRFEIASAFNTEELAVQHMVARRIAARELRNFTLATTEGMLLVLVGLVHV